jgi:hypothetical protein
MPEQEPSMGLSNRVVSIPVRKERDMSGCVAHAVTPRAEDFISPMVNPIEINENKLEPPFL